MESGKTDEEIAGQTQTSEGDSTVKLSGEDETSGSFEEKKAAAEAERAARTAAVPSGSTRSGEGKLETVTVRPGDSLWAVAQRKDVYGSGYLYPLLLQANKAKIKDPNHLPAGLKLTVPRDVPDPQVEIAKEQAMTGELLETTPVPAKAAAVVAAPTASAAAPQAGAKAPRKGRKGWALLAVVLVVGGALAWRWRKKADQA